ncbi:YbaB/EbfC family nucleoid-associated protein [Nocardioides insulae]|uniref:YbaB/EbfC family nucleoid-associated protein n=1 Tax=Nocardioides insulae TaxID=394734 RepID=UPI0003F4FEA0
MSQNPFDALGGGGFDINALFQQAQAMQEQLVSAQEKLAESTVEGTVAGGAVTVRLSGTGELEAVEIKRGEFDGGDPDDLADLGDMIVAAYRDAKAQADALAGQSLGPLAGGLGGLGDLAGGLPGGAGGAGGAGGPEGGGGPQSGGEAGSPRGFGF